MAERARQESREAFVLHSYPYRETSLLLEVFARGFGRLSMVARAARSPRSALRGVLLGFQPLALSWFGKGEVRTLARAEWIGGAPRLQGEALMCGFYVNELLVRLLPREDPHDALFARYRAALEQLASHWESASALRSFERALLKELGYAMTLDRDSASGSAIDPAKTYRYDPERGPVEINGAAATAVSGRTLLDMGRDDYGDPRTQQEAKALMRALLDHRLEYQPLKSRRIFRDLLSL
ncbi:MAG TPA: DNA repair protein RecO [Burkholderiales bacterium]|nr:DNA repair protein RecO [Burkholderiales bacterium]